jgi:predicted RNA methylase
MEQQPVRLHLFACFQHFATRTSALVDTDHIIGIDCDTAALQQAQDNVIKLELNDRISFLQAKVSLQQEALLKQQQHHHHLQPPQRHNGNNGRNTHGRNGRIRQKPSQWKSGISNKTVSTNTGSNSIPLDHSSNSNELFSYDRNSQSHRNRFPLQEKCVDTVMTNPPFGTKADMAGIDIQFVLLACRLARRAVYSFHKTTTREYVLRTIQHHIPNIQSVKVIAEMKFEIKNTYQFHKQKSVDIAVDLIRVAFFRDNEIATTTTTDNTETCTDTKPDNISV